MSDLLGSIFSVKNRTRDLIGRIQSLKCRIDSMRDRGFLLQGRFDLHDDCAILRIDPLPVSIRPRKSMARKRPERLS